MARLYGSNDVQQWVILKPLNDPEKSLMNQQLRVILTRSRSNCHVLGERPPRNDSVAVGVLPFLARSPIYIYLFSNIKQINDNLTQNPRKAASMLAFVWVKRPKKDDPTQTIHDPEHAKLRVNTYTPCKEILYNRVIINQRS